MKHRQLSSGWLLCCAAPTVPQIEKGVQWALAQKQAGRPVYVHCAHGEWFAWRHHTEPARLLNSFLWTCDTEPVLAVQSLNPQID